MKMTPAKIKKLRVQHAALYMAARRMLIAFDGPDNVDWYEGILEDAYHEMSFAVVLANAGDEEHIPRNAPGHRIIVRADKMGMRRQTHCAICDDAAG